MERIITNFGVKPDFVSTTGDIYRCVMKKRAQFVDVNEYTLRKSKEIDSEIKALEKLRHSNIVVLLLTGADFLLLEYVDGSSLYQQPQLATDSIAGVLLQICDALCYVHGEGWYHGDVCTNNIVIRSKDSHAKLIDFGKAGKRDSDARGYGAYGFAPPEAYKDQVVDGVLCDVYALGVVMWCVISAAAVPPMVDKDIQSYVARIRECHTHDLEWPESPFSPMGSTLVTSVSDRPSGLDELKSALESLAHS